MCVCVCVCVSLLLYRSPSLPPSLPPSLCVRVCVQSSVEQVHDNLKALEVKALLTPGRHTPLPGARICKACVYDASHRGGALLIAHLPPTLAIMARIDEAIGTKPDLGLDERAQYVPFWRARM